MIRFIFCPRKIISFKNQDSLFFQTHSNTGINFTINLDNEDREHLLIVHNRRQKTPVLQQPSPTVN